MRSCRRQCCVITGYPISATPWSRETAKNYKADVGAVFSDATGTNRAARVYLSNNAYEVGQRRPPRNSVARGRDEPAKRRATGSPSLGPRASSRGETAFLQPRSAQHYAVARKWTITGECHSLIPNLVLGAGDSWFPTREQGNK